MPIKRTLMALLGLSAGVGCAGLGTKTPVVREQELGRSECFDCRRVILTLDLDLGKDIPEARVDSFFALMITDPSAEWTMQAMREEIDKLGAGAWLHMNQSVEVVGMSRSKAEQWNPSWDSSRVGSKCPGTALGILEILKPSSNGQDSKFTFKLFGPSDTLPILAVSHNTKSGNTYMMAPNRKKTIPDAVHGAMSRASSIVEKARADTSRAE